jgi:hypothetical protein
MIFASAIGFNVLALWLADWFGENQPESPSYTERKTNSDPNGGLGTTAINALLIAISPLRLFNVSIPKSRVSVYGPPHFR